MIVVVFLVIISMLAMIAVLAFAISQSLLAAKYQKLKSASADLTKNVLPSWQGPLPTLLLQLPLYNEIYVVDRLLEAVGLLDYPLELLTVQILDDSTDGTSKIIAAGISGLVAKGINVRHIQRTLRTGYKAGALQAGLLLDRSEYVAIFDADFVPQPSFLKQVLGYFNSDDIGMVQTRWEHINRNESVLTKLLAFGIDAHFSIEQGGRQAYGAFTNFNGTAGVWRRKTIDDAGGWSSDCLTEDLDLSFRAQLGGWKFVFIEDITTPSELPANISSVRVQQFRWTKGAAETGRKNLVPLWSSTQTLTTKVIGTFHMLNSFVFPALLLLSLSLLVLPLFNDERIYLLLWAYVAAMTTTAALVIYSYVVANTVGKLTNSDHGATNAVLTSGLFLLITSGLNLHNSMAVVQGLVGRVTPFLRTPKTHSKTIKLSYLENIEFGPILLELTLGGVFAWNAVHIYGTHYSFLATTYGFFAAGYFMIVGFSLKEIFDRRQSQLRLAADQI